MSYQVLARKWRPQTFSELVGQAHVVKAISNALNNDRLHHAYLFTGTRGVGKTTIARIFAKSINCEIGQSDSPCGKCGTCVDINDGRYVDLLEIDAASRTKVEDTRELLDNVQYKPTRGRYKVYLIDEVHMLSKHSFNALLKTLEEPPEHVKFLLATTDPQKLPITVLSRCLQFNLKQLSKEQISTQLSHILTHEKLSFEKQAVALLASAANGSMRDALSLTDQALAQGDNTVTKDDVTNMLGLLDNTLVLKLVKSLIDKDQDECIRLFDRLCEDAPDFGQLLAQLMSCLHQISLTQIVPDVCKLETSHPRAIYVLAKSASTEHVQLLYQIALQGKRDLPFAPDPKTGVQMTLLRMLAFTPVPKQPISMDSLLSDAAVDEQNSGNESAPVAPVKKDVSYVNAPDNSTVSDEPTSNVPIAKEPISAEAINEAPIIDPPIVNNFAPVDVHTSAPHDAPVQQNETQDISEKPLFAQTPEDDEQVQTTPVTQDQVLLEKTRKNMAALDDLLQSDLEEGSSTQVKKSDQASEKQADPQSSPKIQPSSDVKSLPFDTLEKSIKPILDNGEKLIAASQVDDWSNIIEQLDIAGLPKQLLLHARLESIGDDCVISIDKNSKHLTQESLILDVERALAAMYGKTMKLYIEETTDAAIDNSPLQIQTHINKMREQFARSVVEQDSKIQQIIAAFDARVIEDSIEPK